MGKSAREGRVGWQGRMSGESISPSLDELTMCNDRHGDNGLESRTSTDDL